MRCAVYATFDTFTYRCVSENYNFGFFSSTFSVVNSARTQILRFVFTHDGWKQAYIIRVKLPYICCDVDGGGDDEHYYIYKHRFFWLIDFACLPYNGSMHLHKRDERITLLTCLSVTTQHPLTQTSRTVTGLPARGRN